MSPLNRIVTTYYVRDPQGNVLAVYEHKRGESGNGTFTLTEQHLYGSSRLGMKKRDLALNVANASEPTPVTHYELTNHLGNVMAVISDKASTTAEPTVVSLSDYYPFGMTEPGRSWNPGDYRFGYTGHEKESDLAEGVYITEYRLLDTRLGRWMSVDPLFVKYPDMSSYNYCGGNPIVFWDPDGKQVGIKSEKDGKKVIEKNVVILEYKLSPITEGKGPIKKATNKVKEVSNKMKKEYNESREKRIKESIEKGYSGAKNTQGEPVDFKFNYFIVEKKDPSQPLTREELEPYCMRTSEKNRKGKESAPIYPAVFTTSPNSSDQASATAYGDRWITDIKIDAPELTDAHEVSHTLGLRDNGYQQGGILGNPPEPISPEEVDEIWEKSKWK